jgi:putative transposase
MRQLNLAQPVKKQEFGARPLRLSQVFRSPPLYFVTFCTHQRRACLASAELHTAFIEFANRAYHEFNIAVGRYVIMPDHVHLFVRSAQDFVLGRWTGMLKQCLAKAGQSSRIGGQFWQEGFFDHVLRSDENYTQKSEYVRQNPVRAGLVKSPEDWPYQGEIVYIDRA